MLVLDHIAVAAESLAEGAAHVEAALGVPLSDVGVHDLMGTHNRLLSLGPGLYLEVIAIDPEARPPAQGGRREAPGGCLRASPVLHKRQVRRYSDRGI